MNAFVDFFVNLKDAKWGLTAIIDYIKGVFEAVKSNADISSLWEKGLSALDVIAPYFVYILLALCLVEAFFGKKLLTLQKFLAFFVIGFACGVNYLSPLVDKVFIIPSWITGIVVGIVAAVLCKILYIVVVAVVAGYGTYLVCVTGDLVPAVTNFTKSNWLYSLIAAAVVLLLVFLLLKYLEMLGTAFLGGWGAVICLNTAINFMQWSWLGGTVGVIVFWALTGIVTLIGLSVQWKTRRRF